MKNLKIFIPLMLLVFTYACGAKNPNDTQEKAFSELASDLQSLHKELQTMPQDLCNQALKNYLGSRKLTLVKTRQSESTYGTLDEKYYNDPNFDFEIEVQVIEHLPKLSDSVYYMAVGAVENEDQTGKTFVCSSRGWKEVAVFQIYLISDENKNTSFLLVFTEDGKTVDRLP